MAVDVESLRNVVIVDCHGKEVGEVLDVHRDPFSGRPAWVTVKGGLGGLLHGRSLVPVGDAEPVEGRLQVPYDAATIHKAPYVDLTIEEEALDDEAAREGDDESISEHRPPTRRIADHWQVYEYYGVPFGRPDTTGSASPEADYGFGSAGTSPAEQGSQRSREEAEAAAAAVYPADEPGSVPARGGR